LLAAGALEEAERLELEAHLSGCAACRAKLAEWQNLARGLTEAGRRLPEIEAPVSLRRRWMTEVRGSAHVRASVPMPFLPAWLSGRRLAWGSLTAMWALVLFFRLAAPDAPKPSPSVAAVPPLSLRQVLLALKVGERELPSRAAIGSPIHQKQSLPDALPPRSQCPGAESSTNFNIT
jgi:anti-sigma factor RsiW